MSGEHRQSASDAVRDQAVAWLVRVQSDQAGPDDWAALAAWLEESPAHLAAYDAVERGSAEIDALRRDIAAELARPTAEVVPFRPRPRPLRSRRLAVPAAAAAAAILALTGLLGWQAGAGRAAVFQTGRGQTRSLTLADGTRIRLDAASQISVRMGPFDRQVTMGDAEASFDVAHQAGRPFLIRVGDEQVRVVGTEFNIRHYDGRSVVTVRRGVVLVSQASGQGRAVARLTKGEAVSHRDGSDVFTTARVDPDAAFAWTDGRLVADGQRLEDIVAYLNRRYAQPIRVEGSAADRRFSGVLVMGDDESTTVRTLSRLLSLRQDRKNGAFVLR